MRICRPRVLVPRSSANGMTALGHPTHRWRVSRNRKDRLLLDAPRHAAREDGRAASLRDGPQPLPLAREVYWMGTMGGML